MNEGRQEHAPRLARNTAWMMLAQGTRMLLQAGYFVTIARALGASGYGAFAGCLALVSAIAPFATWGSGILLIRHVAREPGAFSQRMGSAIRLTGASAVLLAVVCLSLSRFALPASIPITMVVAVCASELLFARIVDISAQAFQAFHRLGTTAVLQIVQSTARFSAALIFAHQAGVHTPLGWAVSYLAATVIAAVVSLIAASMALGRPVFSRRTSREDIAHGFQFSVMLASASAYNDIDKTMLTRLSSLEAAGIYAAGYRVVELAFTPVRSLLAASFAHFFHVGETGVRNSLAVARRLMVASAAYALLIGLILVLAAPLITLVLGPQYQAAVETARWLAPLPFLRALYSFPADAISGANMQLARSWVQIGAAVANIAMNLVFIPFYGWRGAIGTTLATECLLVLLFWGLAVVAARRDPSRLVAA